MEQQIWLAVTIAAGVVFGFLIAWFSFRSDRLNIYTRGKADGEKGRAQLEERLSLREQRIQEILQEREQDRATLDRLREENAALNQAKSDAEARVEETRRFAEERLALVTDAQQKLSDTFKALSADVLYNNNQAFLDLAKATLERFQEGAKSDLESRQRAIGDLLQPLRESLEKVGSSIHELEKSRTAAYAGLTEQINALLSSQQQLRGETAGLLNALRAPAVRGRWGEVQLRRVVELAGMVEHCDFEQQRPVDTDDGVQRPDMLIRLPNYRQIVVDAKVSLKAYLEALEAPDEATRQARLKEHAEQVRAHLVKLGSKKYWCQFAEAPEFAVAFLPGETFFSAALEQDPSLIEFGAEQGVILATPTTLIALLKAVAYGWQQQRLAENARRVSELGQTLYDRLLTFTGYVEDLRRNLQRTVDSYNKAAGSLETRVLVSARRFKELGAAGGDELAYAEPVDTVPRALQALDQATIEFPEEQPAPVNGEGGEPISTVL